MDAVFWIMECDDLNNLLKIRKQPLFSTDNIMNMPIAILEDGVCEQATVKIGG
jgi:hypothetical protein